MSPLIMFLYDGDSKLFERDKNILVSIDETTDCTGRHVANVVIGTFRSR